LPVVDILYGEFRNLPFSSIKQKSSASVSFDRELKLECVSFSYPSSHTLAVENIEVVVPKGASIGFVGESGSGKSTLVDLILGLLQPSSGRISADNIDIQMNLRFWQDNIGYVPQSIYLTDDSLRRNIAFGIPDDVIDENAVLKAVQAAQLYGYVSSLPNGLDTVVGERGVRLSGGQRQRIGIARALYHDPPVLVMDEATSALDNETEAGGMEAGRALKGKKTLIIVAHRLSTVEGCDYLYCLNHGKIIKEGVPSLVLRSLS